MTRGEKSISRVKSAWNVLKRLAPLYRPLYRFPMASIQKLPGKPNWIAYFRTGEGKQCARSTEMLATPGNRSKALRFAEGLESMARGERTVEEMHALVDAIADEMGLTRRKSATVSGWLEQWAAERKSEGLKPSTLTFYGIVVSGFLAWLGERAGLELRRLTREMFIEYRAHLLVGRSPRTVRQHLKTLRSIFGRARREGLLMENPADIPAVKLPKSAGIRRPFTEQELRAVLAVAKGEWRGLLLFGLYSGQRLGDIAALRWAALDTTAGVWRFNTGKTGRAQTVPLHSVLRAWLDKWKAPRRGGFVFPAAAAELEKCEGRTANLSHQFADLLAAAGLRSGAGKEATRAGLLQALAVAYGVSRQCIHKWRTLGREKGDACPLDTPAEMAAWFRRHHKIRVPAGILAAAEKWPAGCIPDLPAALARGGSGTRRAMNALSFHSLRHTATSLLSAAGVSRAVAMDLIGHDAEAMNRHYTHVGAGALREAVDTLPTFAP
jgi:integrase